MSGTPALHLIFVTPKGDGYRELWRGKTLEDWTCPAQAQPGDVALFYVGQHSPNGLHAVASVASTPSRGKKAPDWGAKAKGTAFFADFKDLISLKDPIPLGTIKSSFPGWDRWRVLMGVRVHTVPIRYRAPLAELVTASNPSAKRLLSAWLEADRGNDDSDVLATDSTEDLRYEGAVITRQQVRYERDKRNRELALELAKPPLTCVVCGFNFGAVYGPIGKGFIEVHHVVPVSTGRRKPRADELKLLCSNCHSMAHWKSGSKPRTIAQLRAALRGRNGSKNG
jgi:5-methylcytosine-specific restriction protein A